MIALSVLGAAMVAHPSASSGEEEESSTVTVQVFADMACGDLCDPVGWLCEEVVEDCTGTNNDGEIYVGDFTCTVRSWLVHPESLWGSETGCSPGVAQMETGAVLKKDGGYIAHAPDGEVGSPTCLFITYCVEDYAIGDPVDCDTWCAGNWRVDGSHQIFYPAGLIYRNMTTSGPAICSWYNAAQTGALCYSKATKTISS